MGDDGGKKDNQRVKLSFKVLSEEDYNNMKS